MDKLRRRRCRHPIPFAAGAEPINQRIGDGNLPFLLIFWTEPKVKLLSNGEGLCGKVYVPPCSVLDLPIAGSREEKELHELRLLVVRCGQKGFDLVRLIGGDDLLGELHSVGPLERPSYFVMVEEDFQKIGGVRYGAWHMASRLQLVKVIEHVSSVDLFDVLLGAGRYKHLEGAGVGVEGSL